MTEVETPAGQRGRFAHGQAIWTLGSCFADEIGSRLERSLFDVEVNPFGALYNPASILNALTIVAEGRSVRPCDLVECEGLWHSYAFHSRFSGADREAVADMLTRHILGLHDRLRELKTLVVTLGSARCFELQATGEIVANCHKQPRAAFRERELTVEEVYQALTGIRSLLQRYAPEAFMIVTVSPVRYKAYGYHASRLGKARLLLATDRFATENPGNAVYFPAYEIVEDELRDYRFYDTDMIHVSAQAADYIYDRFADTFFSPATGELARSARAVTARVLHRPLNAATAAATAEAAEEAASLFARNNPSAALAAERFVSKYNRR